MAALLSAVDLQKRFGAVVAADHVSIDIAAGERVSLIGSNGAGKTTFVNMVTGYLKPDEGRITLDGQDITPLAPRAITHLGVYEYGRSLDKSRADQFEAFVDKSSFHIRERVLAYERGLRLRGAARRRRRGGRPGDPAQKAEPPHSACPATRYPGNRKTTA